MTGKTTTINTVQFATLVSVLSVSLISTHNAWAFNDYYVNQWEIADKKLATSENEVKKLEKQLEGLQDKTDKLSAKNPETEKKISRIQDKIERKISEIEFLISEIDRLEQLNIESFKVDPETELKLTVALKTLQDKYETNVGFYDALIDFQDGELVVLIHPNSSLTVEQFEEDVNYEVTVNVDGGQHGPVSCISRDGTCSNPLYAGVEIKRDGDHGGPGTLGYYAIHENGSKGFVTAGHVVDWNGASITQPENGRIIGQATEYCGSNKSTCDGAFVALSNGETGSNRIYKTSSSYYNVIGKTADSDQTLGKFVKKSGIGTGITYGSIVGNILGNNYNSIKFNSGNWIASGDSGSPVFQQQKTRSDNVYLYGLLVAAAGNGQYGLYHPQDFLADKLNLQ